MRLSEAITIYLAAGAPFGCHNFLREHRGASRFHSLMTAARAAVLWPLTAAKFLLPRRQTKTGGPAGAVDEQARELFDERVWHAQGRLLSSIHRLAELAQSAPGAEVASVERVARALREAVEKYVGLTLTAAEMNADVRPGRRELELYRVAGRTGPDLMLAGLCAHRRNAARLIVHQARSRTELLHALADIREAGSGMTNARANVVSALHLSVATVRLYARAAHLLSLLEDDAAGAGVARLLDAECTRLRRLEALNLKQTGPTKEELCTPQTPAISCPAQTRAFNAG